jgi:hypothetical protein
MPEEHTRVYSYEIAYRCKQCDELMRYTGESLMSNPPQYVHNCTNGHREHLRKMYPRIDFFKEGEM